MPLKAVIREMNLIEANARSCEPGSEDWYAGSIEGQEERLDTFNHLI